jgi:hypothetical protein
MEIPAPNDPVGPVVPEQPTVPADPTPDVETPSIPDGAPVEQPDDPLPPQPVGPDVDTPEPGAPETDPPGFVPND